MKVVAFAGRMASGKDTAARFVGQRKSSVEIALADELKRVAINLFGLTEEECFGPSASRNKEFATPKGADVLNDAGKKLFDGEHAALYTRSGLTAQYVAEKLHEVFLPELPLKTPRRILQVLGTEVFRSLYDLVWLEALHDTVRSVRYGSGYSKLKGLTGFGDMVAGLPTPKDFCLVTDARFPNEVKYLREKLGASIVWIEADARLPARPVGEHSSEPQFHELATYVTHVVKNETTLEDFEGAIETLVATL